ncbi:MAG: Flp family type IVb pilin [Candidatus Tyrphobacter sp.]
MIIAFRNLVRDDYGASLVEYGLLITLVALAAIAAMTVFGADINSMFSSDASAI